MNLDAAAADLRAVQEDMISFGALLTVALFVGQRQVVRVRKGRKDSGCGLAKQERRPTALKGAACQRPGELVDVHKAPVRGGVWHGE
jgi:hypothetical protein